MFILRVQTGNQAKKTFKLTDELTIGRGSDCAIRLADHKASRSHTLVSLKEGRVYVRDLGSKNGTLCEGERIDEREIKPGAVITVGETNLVLEDVIDESELIGQRLGGYRVMELIGKGGMGVVFKANQLSLDRVVALKVLNKSLVSRKDLVERFLKEARAAGVLSHPNLIQVHDVGKEEETYYFSMEFVNGPTVADLLRRTKNFPERIAVYVIKEVANALEYAHGHELVHRDIKPSNIMIDGEGNVKLADLGIAETLRNIEAQGEKGALMGTPEYMSPEQANAKQAGARSDIYSLGATLYHMVTGRPPFRGKGASDIIRKVRNESPPPLAEVVPDASANLVQLVEGMMAKDAEDRVASASDIIAAVDEKWHLRPEQDSTRRRRLIDFLAGIGKQQEEEPEMEPKISLRGIPLTNLVAGGAALFVIVAVITTFLVFRKPEERPPDQRDEAREEYLKEAGEAYRKLRGYWQDNPQELEGIGQRCRQFLSKYSESPHASQVRRAQETAKTEIQKRLYLEKAEHAYEETEKYAQANPDDLDEQWRKWRDFLADYQKSPLVQDVRAKMKGVRQDMERRVLEKFEADLTAADSLAARGKFHAAVQTLQQYKQRLYDTSIKKKAAEMITTYRKNEDDRFRGMKKAFDQAVRDKRYGEALRVCDAFITEAEQGEKVEEAKALITDLGKKIDVEYESTAVKVHDYLAGFDFVNAESSATTLKERVAETPVSKKARALVSRAAALRRLHTEVVEKIEATEEPKLLPFTTGNIGRGRVAGATAERLRVSFGELQQDLLWSKFSKDEVLQVYRMLLDERFKENKELLKHFAAEFKIKGRYYQP